jgi:hypothetical protein
MDADDFVAIDQHPRLGPTEPPGSGVESKLGWPE